MNRILGKICIVLALCIPLIIGFGIIGVGIIFQSVMARMMKDIEDG